MSQRKAKNWMNIGAWLTTAAVILVSSVGCSSGYYGQQYAADGYVDCQAASENSQAVVQEAELFVRRSPSNPTYVELDMRVNSVLASGVDVTIYLANQSNQSRVIEPQLSIDVGEYFLNSWPDALYSTYDSLVITVYQPGTNFLDGDGTYTAVCSLPALGDGLDAYGNPIGGGTF